MALQHAINPPWSQLVTDGFEMTESPTPFPEQETASSETLDLILDHEKEKAATATMAKNLMSPWSGRKLEAGNWKSWYEEVIRLVVGSGFGDVVLEEGSGGTPKPELPIFAIGGLKENATSFTSKMTTYQK
ncbi:hypothetical protein BT69DRAFT_1365005 [Atractiella rhizophila]|nr:hypothetical protein BT69DRAFT_1365005 [Atractiella rhizophila]